MALVSVNLKLDAEKTQLAKLKGINISQLCRDALDTSLRLEAGELDTLKDQLVEIEKQLDTLTLEKKLVLNQIKDLESVEVIKLHREKLYAKWKVNLATMIKRKKIDWVHQKELFKFSTMEECKKWIIGKLKNDGLLVNDQ